MTEPDRRTETVLDRLDSTIEELLKLARDLRQTITKADEETRDEPR